MLRAEGETLHLLLGPQCLEFHHDLLSRNVMELLAYVRFTPTHCPIRHKVDRQQLPKLMCDLPHSATLFIQDQRCKPFGSSTNLPCLSSHTEG